MENDLTTNFGNFQRYFNPAWYDSTYFSIVAETSIGLDIPRTCELITEKTYKPIAFNHPFIVWGQAGSLQRLNQLGFATYSNIFDESYDQVLDPRQRLEHIVTCIANFEQEPYGKDTLDRLIHNRNHFYNQDIVDSRIIVEVIEPILEYASQ